MPGLSDDEDDEAAELFSGDDDGKNSFSKISFFHRLQKYFLCSFCTCFLDEIVDDEDDSDGSDIEAIANKLDKRRKEDEALAEEDMQIGAHQQDEDVRFYT